MACTTDELSSKIVISVCDGRRLGYICNFEIDICEGRIIAIFVPGEGGLLGFGKSADIRIPWCKITKIGEDAILVEVPPSSKDCDCHHPPRKKWPW